MRHLSLFWSVALALAFTMIAWGFGMTRPVEMPEGDVEAGQAVYKKKCKTCHGSQGQGNAGMAKVLKVTFKHLGAKEIQEKSWEELRKDIVEGMGKMKPVKGLSDQQIADILAYTRTFKQEE